MDPRGRRSADSASGEDWCPEVDHDFRVLAREDWQAMPREMAQPSESQDQKMRVEQGGRVDIIHDAPPT